MVDRLVKKFQACMKPEGLLPCSKEPATGTYLESAESNPHNQPLFIYYNFNIILLSGPRSSHGLSPSDLFTLILYTFLIPAIMLHVIFILY
jgi:hypothetical protein